MSKVEPFFKEASPTETLWMRLCVGTNAVVVGCCAAYLLFYYQASGITWPYLLLAVLAGYFLADFASGAVHWGMDTWFDERTLGRVVAIAREHHTHPQHILGYDFLEHSTLGSAPSAAVIGPLALVTFLLPVSAVTYAVMISWFLISLCLFFGTSFHNMAHRRSRSSIVRGMQRLHIICPPEEHWVHHRNQVIHYCVVNGWANYVCDRFKVWRGLEHFIQATTGAVPRADDLEWQQNYRKTGILAAPPR